ncbi:MAG TPA: class I SAM-dependent methyltransferase [Pseudomonadales bacterium]|nr:class I SAM-dependent methyltransferase [Pseudomonadales bacterium]
MDHLEHNRRAWNRDSVAGGRWSVPVSEDVIESARRGDWQVILTPDKPVPSDWFGALSGAHVLCLASSGGQQAPILAAAGANVVSFDLSEEQLARDMEVAMRDGLALRYVRGDMADLSAFRDASFDLIFHAVSNVFVPDLRPVWRECHRVLRPGGALLAGFMNPAYFLFDHDEAERSGMLVAKHRLPYSEAGAAASPLSDARRGQIANGDALEFGHSLQAQIGDLLAAGFHLTALYEDHWTGASTPLDALMPTSIAIRAVRNR